MNKDKELVGRLIVVMKRMGWSTEKTAHEIGIVNNSFRRWMSGRKISQMGHLVAEEFLKKIKK